MPTVNLPNGDRINFPDGTPEQEMTAAVGSFYPLNNSREVEFPTRAVAGIKMTPEGQAGFYEHNFGKGNVVTDPSGSMFIVDHERKQVFPVNKPGLNLNDAADVSGMALQALPTFAAGTNPLTAGAAAGFGNVVRQGASALLPGDDQMSLGQRAGSLALDSALGAGTQFGANKLFGKVVDGVRPSNVAARYIDKAEQTPFGQQGRALEDLVGEPYTPGQRTGSRTLLTVEGMFRRNPVTADIMAQHDTHQLNHALGFLNQTLDTAFGPGAVGVEKAGGSVRGAFDLALGRAVNLRRSVAQQDFNVINQATGLEPVIPTNNIVTELDDLISRFDVPGGGDATASLVGKLKQVRSNFEPETIVNPDGTQTTVPRKISGAQLERLLEIYGAAAEGTSSVFKNIDTAQQRMIAGRVVDALKRDMNDVLDTGGLPEEVAGALRQARDNYKANSEAIDTLRQSVVGQMLGGPIRPADENIASRIVSLPPSQLRATIDLVNGIDPTAGQQLKRVAFEQAMAKAGVPAGDAPPVTMPDGSTPLWSPKKFATAMRQSPIWSVMDQNERITFTSVIQHLDRLADRAGTDGSPTAPLQQAWDLVKGGASGAVTPFLYALGARRLAQAMTDPEGQRALVALTTTQPGTKSFAGALGYFGALTGVEPASEDVRPMPGFVPGRGAIVSGPR
ncbi:hypothetical protein [Azospirillum sp. sgz302134]